MIKGVASISSGGVLVVLGLSRLNCERLLTGKPIVVRASELNLAGRAVTEILLMAGETEEAMKNELEEFISPEKTIVHDRRSEENGHD